MKNCIFHLIKGLVIPSRIKAKHPAAYIGHRHRFATNLKSSHVQLYVCMTEFSVPRFPPSFSKLLLHKPLWPNPDRSSATVVRPHNAPTVAPPVRSVCSLLRSPILTPNPNVRYHFFWSDICLPALSCRPSSPWLPFAAEANSQCRHLLQLFVDQVSVSFFPLPHCDYFRNEEGISIFLNFQCIHKCVVSFY